MTAVILGPNSLHTWLEQKTCWCTMPKPATRLRLVHVSDIHIWRYTFSPLRLFSKRLLGMGSLLLQRARKFRLERAEQVVKRVLDLEPDHILITGDLTTTALAAEFRAARRILEPWLKNAERVTVIPGNHDRYTVGAHRDRRFEQYFGAFSPASSYPWLRFLDPQTAILGLDPTRASLTARGKLPEAQLLKAKELVGKSEGRIRRLIVACHYPLDAPPPYRRDLAKKNLLDPRPLAGWLMEIGPHLFCCGHVHAAWAFAPAEIPNQLCLNSGAPLLRDSNGHRPPGFLELILEANDVIVNHHTWRHDSWQAALMHHEPSFFCCEASRSLP
jgi:hypothetical protein